MRPGLCSLLLALLIVGAALILGGCARSEAPEAPGDSGAKATADPLTEAPPVWSDFLAWAGQELATPRLQVSLPSEPRLPKPWREVIRLEELFGRAKPPRVDCMWAPPPAGPAALLSLGPFRSDQPGKTLRVQTSDRGSRLELRLTVGGFEIRREQVGSIVIELQQPFGTHFDLIWSRAGMIRVPVPDNRQFWSLNIATDGFADWTGPLRQVSLGLEGVGPGVVEIRSIRFLRREDSFPQAVGVRRVDMDRETRTALYMHTPAEVEFPAVKLPHRARLQVGLGEVAGVYGAPASGRQGATPQGDPITQFEVLIKYQGRQTSVLSRRLGQADAWSDATVPLDEWAGKTVSLILKATNNRATAVACWGNPVVYQAVDDPPCVVIYLIDALGAKHIDLYGYGRPTMPRLSELARGGVWFPNAFANSPRTVESVPDLMLSLPTERHGVLHPSAAAPLELVTLPEVLRAASFATASFCTNVNAGPRQNMDQGFDHFFDRIAYWWTGQADRTVPIEAVMGWLEVHRDRPTFVYIHTAEPHAPYTPPPGYAGRFDPAYDGQIDGTYHEEHGFRQSRTRRDLRHVVALYDEEVAYADARLGAFVDALAAAGVLERATIFVIADHGEEFQEHGQWEHGRDQHDELLRIPLVAVGPTITARGREDVPVQLYDLMPTILAMFDQPTPYPLAGRSLLPLLVGGAGAAEALGDRSIFASNHIYRRKSGLVEHAVIEQGRWKLMYSFREQAAEEGGPAGRFLLFDLQSDRPEKADLLEAHRDVARRLVGRLLRWLDEQAPFDVGRGGEQLLLDAEQLEELRSLGYIH